MAFAAGRQAIDKDIRQGNNQPSRPASFAGTGGEGSPLAAAVSSALDGRDAVVSKALGEFLRSKTTNPKLTGSQFWTL
jgi:hypothetical protein